MEQDEIAVNTDIPRWIWKQAKVKAAEREITVKDLVAQALVHYLELERPDTA